MPTYPEPLFEEIGTHFRVTLYTQPIKPIQLINSDQIILDVLKKSDGLSTKEIATLVKKSERYVRMRLNSLIEKSFVMAIGKGPTDPKRKYFYRIS